MSDLRKRLEKWAYERDFNVNNSTPSQDLLALLWPVIEAADEMVNGTAIRKVDAWEKLDAALAQLEKELGE